MTRLAPPGNQTVDQTGYAGLGINGITLESSKKAGWCDAVLRGDKNKIFASRLSEERELGSMYKAGLFRRWSGGKSWSNVKEARSWRRCFLKLRVSTGDATPSNQLRQPIETGALCGRRYGTVCTASSGMASDKWLAQAVFRVPNQVNRWFNKRLGFACSCPYAVNELGESQNASPVQDEMTGICDSEPREELRRAPAGVCLASIEPQNELAGC
jgi:hypothetical protein